MVATITLSPIVKQLASDYPEYQFQAGDVFSWSHHSRTITYINEASPAAIAQLLHETAHAILDHHHYTRDIDIITMERQAWELAVHQLAPRYNITLTMNDDVVQDALDSYRKWLYARSTCPTCSAVGIEIVKHHYRCLHCASNWRVNEARSCELRRYRK